MCKGISAEVWESRSFSMLGLYLNKCRTAACFSRRAIRRSRVCVSLSMDFCSGFLRLHDLGVWSVQRIMEVLEWNRRKNGVFGY